jgi:hypothetical protein
VGRKPMLNDHSSESTRGALLVASEPYCYEYMINGFHIRYSYEKPPDDAYDEGTLKPLYLAKPDAKSHLCGYAEIGSHTGNILMVAPDWLKEQQPNGVCIDVCIALEISNLWKMGVKTCNSCCGHGKLPASIVVYEESIEKMVELGYELDPFYKNRNDIFLAKTLLENATMPLTTDELMNNIKQCNPA